MTNTKTRKTRLGRGLNTLLMKPVPLSPPQEAPPEVPPKAATSTTNGDEGVLKNALKTARNENANGATSKLKDSQGPTSGGVSGGVSGGTSGGGGGMAVQFVSVAQIVPNPHQPRQQFDETALRQLAQSIKSDGVMQPIIVRPKTNPQNGKVESFELVAGERRWRASQIAQLQTIPAIVRDLDEQQTAEWSLIENLQREDLNPLERAMAFKRLIGQFGMNHAQVAEHVGVERSTISNSLRLLELAPQVQQMLIDGLISNGQAKALAGLGDLEQQILLAGRAVRQGMNVRQVEQAVRKITSLPAPGSNDSDSPTSFIPSSRNGHLADLEQQITQQLGTKTTIKPGRKKGSGSLKLNFYSLDQFDELMARLGIELT